nr:reverse transcriptase domain-containing protein [Tanacetum cinerariifolium]
MIHCKELPGFKYRHDMVRDVLFDICRGSGISAKKESLVNFLTGLSNERSTLRPADVLVFRWVRGKHACVDLTVVSPLVGLSSRGFTMGQTGLKAASYKVTKHEKTCIENQLVFIPFAFDICGFLAPEAVELLNRVQRVMNIHKIRDRCKLLLHAWYLDDGTVIGDSKEVARVLDNIKVCGPGLGLELNVNKKEIFWPSCNGVKLREGLFPVDIRRPSFCVKLLRGAVSRDPDFISGMAMRRLTNSIDLMNLLSQLHDPQSELLLF